MDLPAGRRSVRHKTGNDRPDLFTVSSKQDIKAALSMLSPCFAGVVVVGTITFPVGIRCLVGLYRYRGFRCVVPFDWLKLIIA